MNLQSKKFFNNFSSKDCLNGNNKNASCNYIDFAEKKMKFYSSQLFALLLKIFDNIPSLRKCTFRSISDTY